MLTLSPYSANPWPEVFSWSTYDGAADLRAVGVNGDSYRAARAVTEVLSLAEPGWHGDVVSARIVGTQYVRSDYLLGEVVAWAETTAPGEVTWYGPHGNPVRDFRTAVAMGRGAIPVFGRLAQLLGWTGHASDAVGQLADQAKIAKTRPEKKTR